MILFTIFSLVLTFLITAGVFIFPIVFIAGIVFLIISMRTTKLSLTALILNIISVAAIVPVALLFSAFGLDAPDAPWYNPLIIFSIGIFVPALLLALSLSNHNKLKHKKKLATNIIVNTNNPTE